MATVPQIPKPSGFTLDESGNYVLPSDHRLPGWTVDALIEQGKVDEARSEFERLILEGADSGQSTESPEQLMMRLRARIRDRSDARR